MDYSCIILILLYFSSTQGFLKKICHENDRTLYFNEVPNSFTKDERTFSMNSNKDFLSISRASNRRQLMEIRVDKNDLNRQSRYFRDKNRFYEEQSVISLNRDSTHRRRASVYSKVYHEFDRRIHRERSAKNVERSFTLSNDLRNSLQGLQGEIQREAANRLDFYRNRRISTNIDRSSRNIRRDFTTGRYFNGDRATIVKRETRRNTGRNKIINNLRRDKENRVFSRDSNIQEMHREKRYVYYSHTVPEEMRKNLITRSRTRYVHDMTNTLDRARNRIHSLSKLEKEISDRTSLLRQFTRNMPSYFFDDSEVYRRSRDNDKVITINRINYERRISRETVDNKDMISNRRFLDPTINIERRSERNSRSEGSTFDSRVFIRRNVDQRKSSTRERMNLGRSSIVADRRITLEGERYRKALTDIRSNGKDIVTRRMAKLSVTVDNKDRISNRRFLDPTLNIERRSEKYSRSEDSTFDSRVFIRKNVDQRKSPTRERINLGKSSIVADRRITIKGERNGKAQTDIRNNEKDLKDRRMVEPENRRMYLSRNSEKAFTTDERRFSTAPSDLIRNENVRREIYSGSKNRIQISNRYQFKKDQRSRTTLNERSYDRQEYLPDMIFTKSTIRLTRQPSKYIRNEQRRDTFRQAMILQENKRYRIDEEKQERNHISSSVRIVPQNTSHINWFKSIDTGSWHNAIKVIVISMYFMQIMTKFDTKRYNLPRRFLTALKI